MSWTGRYQGVTAFIGMPGSGKTYGLAEKANEALERGREVWCNAGFDVKGCKVFDSFESFLAIPNGSTIVFDELPIYVNARKWSEFPDGVFYRLTQIRKDGLELYYSAIDESMIDVNVRRLTFWYWKCQAHSGRLLSRSLWPPEKFRKAKQRPYKRQWVIVRDSIASTYDTMAKVAAPTDTQTLGKRGGKWTMPAIGGDATAAPTAADAASPAPPVPLASRRRAHSAPRS